MIGDGDCGEIGGMKIGRGNRSIRRKPAPALLCPPQIPHEQSYSNCPIELIQEKIKQQHFYYHKDTSSRARNLVAR
jgi:hypothetical protein